MRRLAILAWTAWLFGACGGPEPCDPLVDGELPFFLLRAHDGLDLDGDGWGACVDCDPTDPLVYPGAPERCNGVDDDCDGHLYDQEGITLYLDADRDGFGDSRFHFLACEAADALVADDGDCSPMDPTAYPGAAEACNGLDDDCDGEVDEGAPVLAGTEACGCDNGLDDDADGLTDCADPACAAADTCGEQDCRDGRDDDGDGLLDCEDPDCMGTSACYEWPCTDGLDNDEDGFVDCEDEDCWGPDCRPELVQARVVGGTQRVLRVYRSHHWDVINHDGGAHAYGGQTTLTRLLSLRSVHGTVRTDDHTCNWSFDRGVGRSWYYDFNGYNWGTETWGADPIARSGLQVKGGCQLPDTGWFLPDRIVNGARLSGDSHSHFRSSTWYRLGAPYSQGAAFAYTFLYGGSEGDLEKWSGNLLSGSTYLQSIRAGSTWSP